jgi:hypothetical protein
MASSSSGSCRLRVHTILPQEESQCFQVRTIFAIGIVHCSNVTAHEWCTRDNDEIYHGFAGLSVLFCFLEWIAGRGDIRFSRSRRVHTLAQFSSRCVYYHTSSVRQIQLSSNLIRPTCQEESLPQRVAPTEILLKFVWPLESS